MKAGILLAAAIYVIASQTAATQSIPTVAVPDRWNADRQYQPTLPDDSHWWQSLGDTTLARLVDMAVTRNYDVSAAIHRIESARQSLRQARSGYMPTIGIDAGWTRTRQGGSTSSYFSAGAQASWEIDLFGRVGAQVKSAKAGVTLSRADHAAAMVSLCSEVATDYVTLRMYQAQHKVLLAHIASQEKITEITQARVDAGLGSMLDVTQQRVVLYSTQASLPQVEAQIEAQIEAIATLLGYTGDEVRPMLEQEQPMPDYYKLVEVGVPMDLLRRRPDIAQAEASVAQLAASVGIAQKDYLPSLTLTGSIGTTAHRAGDLMTDKSFTYTIAPQLSWTVFDGLARNARVASAKEQLQAGIDSYNNTVVSAINETKTAMTAYTAALRGIGLQESVVEQSQKSLDISVDEYTQGLTAFSNVVDAQVNLLDNQNSLISAKGNALIALINLYTALGGGWD